MAVTINGTTGDSNTTLPGINWQSSIVTAATLTAVGNRGYWINTTSNICTITLPSSASVGDQLVFTDYARTWNTNKVVIDSNGLNYQGSPDTMTVEYNTPGQSLDIVYSGATKGWIPNTDEATTRFTPDYAVDFLVVAGAGGGGKGPNANTGGGGGGAGGYRTSTQTITTGGTVITALVGDGGPGTGVLTGSDSTMSASGLSTITSAGGGSGAADQGGYSDAGGDGGSGGGGAFNGGSAGAGNTPSTSPVQGYAGGAGLAGTSPTLAGGGGGASAVGSAGAGTAGGNGGAGGTSSITGASKSGYSSERTGSHPSRSLV